MISCGTNFGFAFWAGGPLVTEIILKSGFAGVLGALGAIISGIFTHIAFWAGRPLVTETILNV